jgi:hypothetical protein
MAGVTSEARPIDAEYKTLVLSLQGDIEAKVGRVFEHVFEPLTVKTQVVRGLNITATVSVGGGETLTVVIWKQPVIDGADANVVTSVESNLPGVDNLAVSGMAGGVTASKPINDEYRTLALAHRSDIQSRVANDITFSSFTPISYATQVVRGINVFLTIRVASNAVIKVTIWKDVAPPSDKVTDVKVIRSSSLETKTAAVATPVTGGVSDSKIDDDVKALVAAQKSAIEAKANATYTTFDVVSVRKQVVAGTNYFLKIAVGGGAHIDVVIWQKVAPVSYEVTSVTSS